MCDRFSITLLLSSLLATVGHAEVVGYNDQGFHIRVEAIAPANQATTYQQFTRVERWWNADHTWFGKSENLSLEPVAGGCFCEQESDKSVRHMTVVFVLPGQRVVMLGGLGPLQAMGLTGAATFTFEAISDVQTRVIHEYRVSGYSAQGFGKLAPIVESVQQLQIDGLARSLTAGPAN